MGTTRRWSGLRDKAQLCAALLPAAGFTDLTSAIAWRRVWAAFTLWLGALRKGAAASDSLYGKRLVACRACPIYYDPLRTCGSPLAENRKLGCWCHLPTKARLAEATCWLDDELGDDAAPGGWNANVKGA